MPIVREEKGCIQATRIKRVQVTLRCRPKCLKFVYAQHSAAQLTLEVRPSSVLHECTTKNNSSSRCPPISRAALGNIMVRRISNVDDIRMENTGAHRSKSNPGI